jgi:hypothetical protein
VKRTLPENLLFRDEVVQQMLVRVLFIWNMRHPASGYVQGINDIVTPFFVVYLNEYISINFDTLEVP